MSSRVPRVLCLLCLAALAAGALMIPTGQSSAFADKVEPTKLTAPPAPELVTLKGKGLPLSEVLQRFTKKTGVGIVPPGDDPKINLDLTNVPFWQALDEIAKESNLSVYPYLRDGKLSLRPGYREIPVSYNGIFRAAMKRVIMTRDLETDAHYGAARLELAWQPPFQAFLLETQPTDYVIQDDKGTNLTPPRIGKGHASVIGRSAVELDLPLPGVNRAVPRLGLVKGNVSLIGSARMIPFKFAELAKSKQPQKIDGVTVTITEVEFKTKKPPHVWTVQLELRYPPGPKLESFQMQTWLLNNQFYLVRGKQRVLIRFPNTPEGPADPLRINYVISEGDEGEGDVKEGELGQPATWTIEYLTPSPVVEVSLPFEFKDVPLP